MKPFLVAIPMPNSQDAGSWLYNVHSYPKNAIGAASKTVDDSRAFGLGDIVQWTIATKVPNISGMTDFTRFEIKDTLPAEVSYTGSSVEILDINGKAVADIQSPKDYVIKESKGEATLEFTAEGRRKLENHEGGAVKWVVSTRVNSIGKGDIVNNAVVYENDAEIPVSATSYWGAADIVKYQTGTKKLLDGAVFEIYRTKDGAVKRDPSSLVAVSGAKQFPVEKNGTVRVAGLKVGQYYVVETRAPAGYVASTDVHQLDITRGGSTQLSIENSQQPFGALPPLGGVGLALSVIIGAIAVGGAILLAVIERRRRKQISA